MIGAHVVQWLREDHEARLDWRKAISGRLRSKRFSWVSYKVETGVDVG